MPARPLWTTLAALLLTLACDGGATLAQPVAAARLAAELQPWLDCFAGRSDSFELTGHLTAPIDGRPQQIEISLRQAGAESFDLRLAHPEYAMELRRRAEATAWALPLHRVVYAGRGALGSPETPETPEAHDHLAPAGLSRRLVSGDSLVAAFVPLLSAKPATLGALLRYLTKVSYDEPQGQFLFGEKIRLQLRTLANSAPGEDAGAAPRTLDLQVGPARLQCQLRAGGGRLSLADSWPDGEWKEFQFVELPRSELERTLARGLRRVLEIAAPAPSLTSPEMAPRRTAHGELRWIEGQRVALLQGTPEEIGRAHGQLLKVESQRCIDSVLHAFGAVQTIRTGRWFRHDLQQAYARLEPHIPADHQREIAALADELGIERQLAQTLNVFPELFHCSGFAVYGDATVDGKLYHGRVLDYMTTIGLQDAATTFVVAVNGKHGFANVGYAGFVGSVSGMNDQAISLGEMGGRGEGQWDGAPMATLMRRALEECGTLDDVVKLWKSSPRTCEYYYVFADGKTNRAVGVAAVPEKLEVIQAGQSDPRIGEGIPDAVVLSAGSRLAKLRERVLERYGKIDAEAGQWLMSRPVAMQSNLHNVLFVPADGVLYVANADHRHPAAERPYVKLSLKDLLAELAAETPAAAGGE